MYGLGDVLNTPATAVSAGPPCSWYQGRGSDGLCHFSPSQAGMFASAFPAVLLATVSGDRFIAPALDVLPDSLTVEKKIMVLGGALWLGVGLLASSLFSSKKRGRR